MSDVELDTFDPAFLADPYETYAQLRATAPVAQVAEGFFRLTRYADVGGILRHPGASAERLPLGPTVEGGPDLADAAWTIDAQFATWMLMLDPPDHTRLRALVNKAFTPRVVEGLRARVEEIVAELLADAAPGVELDLIETLAYPLPTRVIAELIGVPAADAALLKRWSNDIAALLGNGSIAPNRDEILRAAAASIDEFSAYLRDRIAARRREPRDDLLSGLVAAEEDGATLTEAELVGTVVLLLVAGHETTTNLIGNGMLALLRHPEERRRLRDDPSLLEPATEELLRFDSPVQATVRSLTAPYEASTGETLPAGAQAAIWIGSANRDEAVFTEPDRLDVGRREARHLSFAHGQHYCVGASLARLEAHCAFAHLLHRLPDAELVTEPAYRPNPLLRGLTALELRFGT